MSAVPIESPLRASEAAALADLVFQQTDGRNLTDDTRGRLAGRVASLGLTSVRPYFGSLAKDPVQSAGFYLAIDALDGAGQAKPMLLHLTLASSPQAPLFDGAVLIGRSRAGGGREVIVNAAPFSPLDRKNVRTFVLEVDRSFLPRPQGAHPAIAVGNRHPEVSLPAAFDAFRSILRSTGTNMASTVQLSATREMTTDAALEERDGENPTAAGHTRVSIEHLYHAGLWAAVRAGWREGYNAEADHFIVTGTGEREIARSVELAKEAILAAEGYTKFTTDTSRLFELQADRRWPQAWSDAQVNQRYEVLFRKEDRRWIESEFRRQFDIADRVYRFPMEDVRRMAVKFGRSLFLNEELYDFIKQRKSRLPAWKSFDFEPSLDEAETLTTPEELIFYMHWLKARGRPAQLVPPNLGFKKRQAYPETLAALEKYAAHKHWPELLPRAAAEFAGDTLAELGSRVSELSAVAKFFSGTLSIHSGSGKQAAVLQQIGRATGGRVNYKISGELQLQLFDVLSEEPETSDWKQLYNRMAERCNQFAASGAFGEESALASAYGDFYLGDASKGRTDGNLFLVFWLGNLVGSRDIHAPDGDTRFFKDKLDRLPDSLIAETRKRNTRYIAWLAEQLRG